MKNWLGPVVALSFLFVQPVAAGFSTVDEAARSIGALGSRFQRAQDRRGLFANIYALTIRATARKLANGEFQNPAWVRSLVINYANIYNRTIRAELSGQRARLPLAWQQEFAYLDYTHAWTPGNPDGFLWSADLDIVYGIHVHIARDLVEALLVTPTDFNSPSVRADYFLITEALRGAMPSIWNVFLSYEQQLHLSASIEQPLMINWIAALRAQAWESARAASGLSRAGQQGVLSQIDARVARESRQHGIFLLLR